MSGTPRRTTTLVAALLLLLVHVVLPGLHRLEHVHEAHAEPASSCCSCHAPVPHDPDPRDAKVRHCHAHGADCALCTVLLARGELMPCGESAPASRPAPCIAVAATPTDRLPAARRLLPPPARAPPTA